VADDKSKDILARLDWDLQTIFQMITRLGTEAHLEDEQIADIINTANAEPLEIISDMADEVTLKAQAIIVEARLAIREARGAKA
jgi:hypothetical protein